MKNIARITLLIVLFSFACDDVKAPSTPSGVLEVNYDFGALGASAATDAIYVCLYYDLDLYPDNYMFMGQTAASPATSGTVTVSNIWTGTYYVVVFYDQYTGDTLISENDPYVLYDADSANNATNSPYTVVNSENSTVAINKNSITTISITYDGSTLFGAGGSWDF